MDQLTRVRESSAAVGRVRVGRASCSPSSAVQHTSPGTSTTSITINLPSVFLSLIGDVAMIWLLWLPVTLAAPGVFPLVDPGLFVISGVRTCGGGAGYCLLGLDCTLDEDFLPDEGEGQHCEGLRSAFTPSAHFVCCRAANNYKQPAVPVTTPPLDVLQNEVEDVLQKVAESVEAAKRTPAPEAELRETQSEGSTLLEEEVFESSIEGGVLQGDDGSEEGTQNDDEYKDEQEHASVDVNEELYQNDAPSEAVSILQEPKIEDSSSEEKSTEENTISSESSESSEEESSSSSEETDSDEVLTTTTNKSEQKPPQPPPSQGSPSISETQNDFKGNVDKESEENNTEGVVPPPNEVSQEESETLSTSSPEENVTEQLMSKETLSVIDETNLDDFQRDENTKEPVMETSSPEIKGTTDKNTTSTEKPDMSKEKISLTPQNTTLVSPELSFSKPVKTKTKPLPGKKTANKDTSRPSSAEVSFNEVVSTSVDKQVEENSVHNEGRPVVRTNSTNANSHTDTEGGFATDSSVHPEHQASGRPASQGHEGVVCSRTSSSNNNCSREIRFEFENRTLCFGSVYSLDWVVTSASCALRVFRAGMLNVSVSPLEGASRAAVKTIVVHESYAENAGLSGQHMEANNIGLVQLRTTMREWAGCVSCLPQPGLNFTSNCSALTDRPMAPTTLKCPTDESCKSSRAEESRAAASLSSCQGRARDMKDDLGFHYLTLACDTLWEPRFTEAPQGSGSPLYCGDVLAGLEASAGMGLMVYTPVVRYLDWLRYNTRTSSPDQHFNLH